ATQIANSLCKDFYDHGYAVGRQEAKQLGLNITEDKNVQDQIWKIWLDFEKELEARKVFTPINVLMNSSEGPKLSVPVVVTGAAGPGSVTPIPADPVDVDVISALVESPRLASRSVDNLRIIGRRNENANIEYNMIVLDKGWKNMTIPTPTNQSSNPGSPLP